MFPHLGSKGLLPISYRARCTYIHTKVSFVELSANSIQQWGRNNRDGFCKQKGYGLQYYAFAKGGLRNKDKIDPVVSGPIVSKLERLCLALARTIAGYSFTLRLPESHSFQLHHKIISVPEGSKRFRLVAFPKNLISVLRSRNCT